MDNKETVCELFTLLMNFEHITRSGFSVYVDGFSPITATAAAAAARTLAASPRSPHNLTVSFRTASFRSCVTSSTASFRRSVTSSTASCRSFVTSSIASSRISVTCTVSYRTTTSRAASSRTASQLCDYKDKDNYYKYSVEGIKPCTQL